MLWDIVLVTVHAQKALLKAKKTPWNIYKRNWRKKTHKVGAGEEVYMFSLV